MLIKLLGGVIIITASCGIGQTIAYNQEMLARELAELLSMIRLVKSELKYAVNDLPEAFADMAPRLDGAIGSFCNNMAELLNSNHIISFQDAWGRSMDKLKAESRFGSTYMEHVSRLGSIIGYMDVDGQIMRLELLEDMIEHDYKKEREKTKQTKKLSGSLGIFGGLFLVILML